MAKQVIGIGATANDGTGDLIRDAFDKANDNFTELYDEKLSATIDTPVLDNVIKYNGAAWVNAAASGVSGSPGVEFYADDAVILAGASNNNRNIVETLLKIPRTAAEQAQVVEAFTTNSVMTFGEAYLYNVALHRTQLDAGVWTFNTYCSVNTNANGVPQILRNVYRVIQGTGTLSTSGSGAARTATAGTMNAFVSGDGTAALNTCGYLQTPQGLYEISAGAVGGNAKVATIAVPNGGTPYANETDIAAGNWKIWKLQFGVTSNVVNVGTSYGLVVTLSTQGAIALTADGTDRLGCIVLTTATSNKVINFVHNGAVYASHIQTPLITVHGNLAGLQGGTGAVPTEEYYHLTSAQHTIATTAATDSVPGYLSAADHTTFAAKQAALTFGIANTNKVQINSADVGSGEYAKFTASGLEGKTFAEVRSDLAVLSYATKTVTLTVSETFTVSSADFTPAFTTKPKFIQVWTSDGILVPLNTTVTFNTPNYDIILSITEQIDNAVINVLL